MFYYVNIAVSLIKDSTQKYTLSEYGSAERKNSL